MDNPLRIGDVDVVFSEAFDDFLPDAERNAGAAVNVGRIAVELEIEAVVAQIRKLQGRRRRIENFRIFAGNFEQDGLDLVDVAVVVDPDLDFHPTHLVAVGFVNQTVGQNGGVGDDDIGLVPGFKFGRAHVNAFNDAFLAVDDNPVADLNLPFKQNGQTGDQTADHVLQAETGAERQ